MTTTISMLAIDVAKGSLQASGHRTEMVCQHRLSLHHTAAASFVPPQSMSTNGTITNQAM